MMCTFTQCLLFAGFTWNQRVAGWSRTTGFSGELLIPWIRLSIYQSIHLSIYPSINLSIYPSIHLSIYPSVHLSIYLSIYPSIYLSIHLSIRIISAEAQLSRLLLPKHWIMCFSLFPPPRKLCFHLFLLVGWFVSKIMPKLAKLVERMCVRKEPIRFQIRGQ